MIPAPRMAALRQEYERKDCLWSMLYSTLSRFKSQYDAGENRNLLAAQDTLGSIEELDGSAVPEESETAQDIEPEDL